MDRQETLDDAGRFGSFLRRVREGRRLSLDAVEEMSSAYPERLTKSHLSRIENGLAEPSFRKLFALSQIYGVPLTSLAEQFELDLQRELHDVEISAMTPDETDAEIVKRIEAGRYAEALPLLAVTLDRLRGTSPGPAAETSARWICRLRLQLVDCLVHLGRYESAKHEVERLLGEPGLDAVQRLRALAYFVICCHRLRRYTVADMALDQAEKDLSRLDDPPGDLLASLLEMRGNIHSETHRHQAGLQALARALKIREERAEPFAQCRVRINMANALIETDQLDAAREQLEAALLVAESSGYDRLRALAMSHMAVIAFRRGDTDACESWAIRSNRIARSRDFLSLVFRNCFYLMRVASANGDAAGVKANERTLRSLLGRIDENLPEATAFREIQAGGA